MQAMEKKKTEKSWTRYYFQKLWWKVLVTALLLGTIIAVPLIWDKEHKLVSLFLRFNAIAITGMFMAILNVILKATYELLDSKVKYRKTSLKGVFQIMQIVMFFIGGIIIVAILMDKSPAKLLTGLGAFAAVLSFIFKDTILGFVSGIQLSSNDMVRPGDWIVVPSTLANGVVTDISLITVKVQNFDNTIVTVPTYSLVTSSFQNWRGMDESGGRRMTVNLNIDMDFVHFCTPDELEKLKDTVQIPANADKITNLELYRIYLATYIHRHPGINNSILTMVRYMDPTSTGLPVQIYCFTRNKSWVIYEGIKSQITEHAIAVAPQFGLKIFNWGEG